MIKRPPFFPIDLPVDIPVAQRFAGGQVLKGGEERGFGDLVGQVVFDRVGQRIKELLLGGFVIEAMGLSGRSGKEVALAIVEAIHASGDEAVAVLVEFRRLADLFFGEGVPAVQVINGGFEPVEGDRVLFEGAADGRADDVDGAGNGDDVPPGGSEITRLLIGI